MIFSSEDSEPQIIGTTAFDEKETPTTENPDYTTFNYIDLEPFIGPGLIATLAGGGLG